MWREYKVSYSIKLGSLSAGQSYAAYMKNGPTGGFGYSEDPIVKVVDNLELKFNQVGTGVASGNWYQTSSWNRLANPLFMIKDVRVVKGFSVIEPNIPITTSSTIVTTGVAPVPAVAIPAWREIYHNYFNLPSQTWNLLANADGSSPLTTAIVGAEPTFGDNRGAISTQGVDAAGNSVNYVVPEGFTFSHDGSTDAQGNATLWDAGDYTSSDSYSGVITTSTLSGMLSYDRTTTTVTPSATQYSNYFFDDYIEIISETGTSETDINHMVTIEPWVVDNWYLVDIEFDETYNPDAGDGSVGNGEVLVLNVAPTGANFVSGGVINNDGIGEYAGDSTNSHVRLMPTVRTRYGGVGYGVGDGKTVLRGLFQFASDSYIATTAQTTYPNDLFTLKVVGCTNGMQITKIHCKHLDALPTAGVVNDWSKVQQSSYNAVHSFSNNALYYKNNKLVWQLPANASGITFYDKWEQSIATPQSIYETIWHLSFTISENPVTNVFSGAVGGVIGVEDNTIFRGFAFNDITTIGNYLLVFDLNQTQTVSNWKAYRENIGTPVTENSPQYSATLTPTADLNNLGWFSSNAGNKIQFFHKIGVNVTAAQEFAISNISFMPIENTFLSGSIGAWNISNFDSITNNYITLDNNNNYFVFDDCPIYETGETQFININQQVDEPVNKNDQYKISFTHEITQGEIHVYYYNSEGFGFRIENIGGATAGQPINFEEIVTIGQRNWSPDQGTVNSIDYSPTGLNLDSDLQNSFVIVAGDNGNLIEGFIDNISMVRVFVDAETSDKTITFNEAVNGWSSFKSFVPESGVSLSKKYFTFKDGNLWQHYVPKVDGATEYASGEFQIKHKAEEANNYNNFYDNQYGSKVQFVSNQDPSTVKMFNTINYEGSQTYITKPLNESDITIDNAIAWTNSTTSTNTSGDILGWECTEIKTDLDIGSITEFIKKEGKWFNYIKGANINQALDTSRFDVQGVGVVSGYSSVNFL